jgi:signal transduction histidine kinase
VKTSKLLLVTSERTDLSAPIAELLPDISLVSCTSSKEALSLISSDRFDILVVESSVPPIGCPAFIRQVQCVDHVPQVVVLVNEPTLPEIIELNDLGTARLVFREGTGLSSLIREVRSALRYHRMVEEHTLLLAQLHEANELLRERNRRLDEFSATVAHDLRGPLGGIIMKLDFLIEHHGDQLDPRATQLIRKCLDSTARLTDIVQAMYEFAKLGTKAAKMLEVDLSPLLAEVIADLSLDDAIHVQITCDNLPRVWGNPGLLRVLFGNLLSNAVKYSDKDQVLISLSGEGVHSRPLGRFAEIRVRDNGPGIDEKDLTEIFTMFRRGLSSTQVREGLGVGLAMVQRIVELHYGHVEVETGAGDGTTFILSLPVERVSLE